LVKTKKLLDLEELVSHVDEHYSGIYQSKQSYYDLFDSAEISWKKSHSCQPKVRSRISKKKNRNSRVFGSEPNGD
jgi:putative transposase